MSKMGLHDPLEYLKHKLWPNERLGVKLPIWFSTTKSQKSLQFPYVQVAYNIPLESFWQGLQFCFRLHFNWRSTTKLWAFKVVRILGQNDIWVLAPWLGTKNTIKGKVVASFKSRSWWVLWIRVCSWFVRAPKMFQLCTNQLVVWFV
jgi:hypothetical protein